MFQLQTVIVTLQVNIWCVFLGFLRAGPCLDLLDNCGFLFLPFILTGTLKVIYVILPAEMIFFSFSGIIFQDSFELFLKHDCTLWCTPLQIPHRLLKHPRNLFFLQRVTAIPIMKKYVQEAGDCHRFHGNFLLINFRQKLAARASLRWSQLPEVDPIFCLNRH